MDRASMAHAERLEGHAPSVPEVVENARPDSTLRVTKYLLMGWALKASTARRSRFTTVFTASQNLKPEDLSNYHIQTRREIRTESRSCISRTDNGKCQGCKW